jgi:hypothetical protein
MQFPFSIRIKNVTRTGKQQQLSTQEEKGKPQNKCKRFRKQEGCWGDGGKNRPRMLL